MASSRTVAVVVPFRAAEPLSPEDRREMVAAAEAAGPEAAERRARADRARQLRQFLVYMRGAFLPHLNAQLPAGEPRVDFRFFVVEQSADGRKFNRGKLLNAGFAAAAKYGAPDWYLFHDVDLLPSLQLHALYARAPDAGPVHIGKLFGRYNSNPHYFGGVVAMSETHFRATNGYPNTFFGWGGEDESQLQRLRACGLYSAARDPVQDYLARAADPADPWLLDQEDMPTFDRKKRELDATRQRCDCKYELKDRDAAANLWLLDGLQSLVYVVEDSCAAAPWCVFSRLDVSHSVLSDGESPARGLAARPCAAPAAAPAPPPVDLDVEL